MIQGMQDHSGGMGSTGVCGPHKTMGIRLWGRWPWGHGNAVGPMGVQLWGDGVTWDIAMGWNRCEQGHITMACGDIVGIAIGQGHTDMWLYGGGMEDMAVEWGEHGDMEMG